MSFIYNGIKNHFHINGFVFSLALKQRLWVTRKRPIGYSLGCKMRCVNNFFSTTGKGKGTYQNERQNKAHLHLDHCC